LFSVFLSYCALESADDIRNPKSLASSGQLKDRNFLLANPVLDRSRLNPENLRDAGSVNNPSRIDGIKSTGLHAKSRLDGG